MEGMPRKGGWSKPGGGADTLCALPPVQEDATMTEQLNMLKEKSQMDINAAVVSSCAFGCV